MLGACLKVFTLDITPASALVLCMCTKKHPYRGDARLFDASGSEEKKP